MSRKSQQQNSSNSNSKRRRKTKDVDEREQAARATHSAAQSDRDNEESIRISNEQSIARIKREAAASKAPPAPSTSNKEAAKEAASTQCPCGHCQGDWEFSRNCASQGDWFESCENFVLTKPLKVLIVETKDIWGLYGWDGDYNVQFDMTFNNHDGPLLSSLVRSAASNVVCRKLVVLVKQFAKVQNINDNSTGTLKSIGYCLLCMSFLQEMGILPRIHFHESKELDVQQRDAEKFESVTREFRPACIPEISDLLYMFFRYYLYDFDFTEYAVTINKTRPIKKAALGFPHADAISGEVIEGNIMVISNPFEKEENIASTVNKEGMDMIRVAFETACKRLRNGGDIFHPFK